MVICKDVLQHIHYSCACSSVVHTYLGRLHEHHSELSSHWKVQIVQLYSFTSILVKDLRFEDEKDLKYEDKDEDLK